MKNSNIIFVPEILGKSKPLWTERDFTSALKKFRQNAPSAPLPRLYDAYKWLKEEINLEEENSSKQFTYFIEIFLRILEERGASGTEIYSEVLRDSAEYKFLKGLFHNDDPDYNLLQADTENTIAIPPPAKKEISLKKILLNKNMSLLDFDIDDWCKLIVEYFRDFNTETVFVQKSSTVISNIRKRTEIDPYHIEIIVVYAFDKLLTFKTLTVKSKDFAMELLNMMSSRGEIWNRLHKEYLEIIKK